MTTSARDERTRRVLIASDALDAYFYDDDLHEFMDWVDGERVYAAGRGEHLRAETLAEVQRELRGRRLDGRDLANRSLEAAREVVDALDGEDEEGEA